MVENQDTPPSKLIRVNSDNVASAQKGSLLPRRVTSVASVTPPKVACGAVLRPVAATAERTTIAKSAGMALRQLFAAERKPNVVPQAATEEEFSWFSFQVEICSRDQFLVKPAFGMPMIPHRIRDAMEDLSRSLGSTMASVHAPTWRFPFARYDQVLERMRQRPLSDCPVDKPPAFIVSAMVAAARQDELTQGQVEIQLEEYFARLPDPIRMRRPMEFQMEGIRFGIARDGRCLLADEMGLGKTMQALTIAAQYQDEWPVLVVAPASLLFVWKEQSFHWLPHLLSSAQSVQVVSQGKQTVDLPARFVIVSYALLTKHAELQVRADGSNYKVVIVDESQYIKSAQAERTRAVMRVCARAGRCLLISGTPMLNRRSELYTQLTALRPDMKDRLSLAQFTSRYCSDWARTAELNAFLCSVFMSRHLKSDVLHQLPRKIRQRITLPPTKLDAERIGKVKQEMNLAAAQLEKALRTGAFNDPSLLPTIRRTFLATAEAKVQSVAQYIEHLVSTGAKFLVFAHHHVMLDALERQLRRTGIGYVRIDGKTPQSCRADFVQRFQTTQSVQVALLSITACGQGLTLTAASTVVFAELYWVPGQMLQAEDRAHRIGQESHVDVHYCIAQGTLDERMFNLLNEKHRDTSGVLDGLERGIEVEHGTSAPLVAAADGTMPPTDDDQKSSLREKTPLISTIRADDHGTVPCHGAVEDSLVSGCITQDPVIHTRRAGAQASAHSGRTKTRTGQKVNLNATDESVCGSLLVAEGESRVRRSKRLMQKVCSTLSRSDSDSIVNYEAAGSVAEIAPRGGNVASADSSPPLRSDGQKQLCLEDEIEQWSADDDDIHQVATRHAHAPGGVRHRFLSGNSLSRGHSVQQASSRPARHTDNKDAGCKQCASTGRAEPIQQPSAANKSVQGSSLVPEVKGSVRRSKRLMQKAGRTLHGLAAEHAESCNGERSKLAMTVGSGPFGRKRPRLQVSHDISSN